MRNRIAFAGILAVATVITVTGQTQPAAKTPAKAAAKAWKAPRTPEGVPDLQGFWTNNTLTPLERPKALGSKEFYTDQEVADAQKKEQKRLSSDLAEGLPTERGTAADVHYDFAQYGLDKAQSSVVWDKRTSLIVGPTGTIPALLPEARKRAADVAAKNRGHEFDGPENRPLSARCIIMGYDAVPMLPAGYNNNLQIVQGQGYVTVLHEMNHSARVIPTDARPHPSQIIGQYRGNSSGHWEGDTLVVDVTNFNDHNPFRGSGDKLHVVERYTRVDAETMLYRFTVEDPGTWDQPWTAELAWTTGQGPIYEFGCHEGNYGLANTLRGARVAEQEAARNSGR
ncbi:MAG TPA: hypothetical protein VGJ09_09170 [Bryobacteraceae bacterium]